ncbi:hypothetical protein H9Y04_24690 [Streptomyces sp. TRM66268-LWL]|uniref:Integral membrane protein n=1 Tax=Streptomyces polyasparticus TaxID=2767826 RepID=A0ABR7SJS7_9ACTN|nr:hypothetical protein [Streptomyces polyasparticus]MBC9715745.1 hypothetical protein [Streptomyces polyasparticus]
MSDQVRPDEAARALTEIDRRQAQIIRAASLPRWFWAAIGFLLVAFAVIVDATHGALVQVVAAVVFMAGALAAVGSVAYRSVRGAQPRTNLVGPRVMAADLAFTAVIVGVSLAASFTLTASGVSYAATIGASTTAAILVVGGPMYTRYRQGLMLANRSGGRR